MKNMKIGTKLMVAFVIVAVMAAVAGIAGIIGLNTLNKNEETMHVRAILANDVTALRRNMQNQRAIYRGAAMYFYMGMSNESELQDLVKLDAEFDATLISLEKRLTVPENQEKLKKVVTAYDQFSKIRDEILDLVASDEDTGEQIAAKISEIASPINVIATELDAISVSALNLINEMSVADGKTAVFLIILMIVLAVLAVGSAMFFAVYMTGLIAKPLKVLTAFMNKAGSTGDLRLEKADEDVIGMYAKYKDETGQCINSSAMFVQRLNNVSKALEMVANGDLTAELSLLSKEDTMGLSLEKMVKNLNNMFNEINMSTSQVTTGSKQIADGSQALAQGSTEQAAAVEQLSASIAEISEKTKSNADMARKAADLSVTIMNTAKTGSTQMDEMMQAVREINEACQSINKVIALIENIAFQTNILALNAAVEAARAGQHGKGFAVVAEEVRSLASKSADAAKNTSGLIANSMEKSELGTRIAAETYSSLTEIVSGINKSTQLIGEISKSSEEQAMGISQINKGIDQVAQVIQQNSATAEESAAASEEMSGQANMLEELVSQFKLKDGGSRALQYKPEQHTKRLEMPEKSSYSSGSFGKY